jgi:hypothetical protein
LSDPHLPGRNQPLKEKALQTIAAWPDLSALAVTGDLCQRRGSPAEYASAKAFFGHLSKPFWPITGNHDYIYSDAPGPNGRLAKAGPAERAEKLQRFKAAFGLREVYYSRRLGEYLLLFLSADDLETSRLTALSSPQLAWARAELARHQGRPTIVFFHGPLKGTAEGVNLYVGNPDFHAQPEEAIDRLLADFPQICLWVSGHIHLAPTNRNYLGPASLYQGRVVNLHVADMDGRSYLDADRVETTSHSGLWSYSLFLQPDRVTVKVFDHAQDRWLPEVERMVKAPVKK